MQIISTLIRWEMWFLLGSLALIIAGQILTGKINTRRMLFEKNGGQNYSPLRVQLLLLTLMTAFYQIMEVLRDPTQFPSLPYEALLVLGGGNLAYLGGKFYLISPASKPDSRGHPRKKRRIAG